MFVAAYLYNTKRYQKKFPCTLCPRSFDILYSKLLFKKGQNIEDKLTIYSGYNVLYKVSILFFCNLLKISLRQRIHIILDFQTFLLRMPLRFFRFIPKALLSKKIAR